MGTRHLTMVVKDGQTKVAQYGQFDGYLSGAGVAILKFLKMVDMKKFRKKLDNVSFYTNEELDKNWERFAIKEGIDPKAQFINIEIANKYDRL